MSDTVIHMHVFAHFRVQYVDEMYEEFVDLLKYWILTSIRPNKYVIGFAL